MGYQNFDPIGKSPARNPLVLGQLANQTSMRPHLAVVTGIDPQLTRNFLLSQPAVIDATVWYQLGKLHAEVAVSDARSASPSELQNRCVAVLGALQAPKEIRLIRVRSSAA